MTATRAHRHTLPMVMGSSVLGALFTAFIVFMNRPQGPPNACGPGSVGLCHPIYVGKVPPWFYAAATLGGALIAAGVAIVVLWRVQPPRK